MDHVIPNVCTTLLAARLVVYWLGKTNTILPDPYLDEVFHVRQAQAYWDHRWKQWDPKITTPPGLYLVSYAITSTSSILFAKPVELSASVLRCINGLVLFNALQFTIRRFLSIRQDKSLAKGETRANPWTLSLNALNICLFPPIFFFSGLYYTDLAALLTVLEVCNIDLGRSLPRNGHDTAKSSPGTTIIQFLSFLVLGLAALVFRQTNIFWVAVFLGGLRVVNTLQARSVVCISSDVWRIIKGSWYLNQIYDPPASDASIEDYFKVGFSLAISFVANLSAILVAVLPYLFFLGCFGLFVLVNGSVVLGK
ncbi:glucosyltransferase [Microsporum audouinii]